MRHQSYVLFHRGRVVDLGLVDASQVGRQLGEVHVLLQLLPVLEEGEHHLQPRLVILVEVDAGLAGAAAHDALGLLGVEPLEIQSILSVNLLEDRVIHLVFNVLDDGLVILDLQLGLVERVHRDPAAANKIG